MIKQYVVNGQLTVVRFTHDHHITGNHITLYLIVIGQTQSLLEELRARGGRLWRVCGVRQKRAPHPMHATC